MGLAGEVFAELGLGCWPSVDESVEVLGIGNVGIVPLPSLGLLLNARTTPMTINNRATSDSKAERLDNFLKRLIIFIFYRAKVSAYVVISL